MGLAFNALQLLLCHGFAPMVREEAPRNGIQAIARSLSQADLRRTGIAGAADCPQANQQTGEMHLASSATVLTTSRRCTGRQAFLWVALKPGHLPKKAEEADAA